ncbi:MAG: 50S ribosomal protein L23 [Acidobacteria bacterium]|nr:50S ribosomal protein L23 [Acidobacteriota bacterium]MCH7901195.1 50S ribosomal protein L23 [Acidobacteriota bacterium]TDI50745.1 MAG: 50S ribosomal protein L23 [Acidobacteriota bacterium]TDI54115.1 MAG: 50S ribosomal protein L23 [Acidobacteriota bacterium]
MKTSHDIIFAPVVSEKSYDLIDNENTYTFEVDPRSNKEEIRDAIEEVFDVTVLRVNTMNRKGKRKRSGYTIGRRKDVKRAIVKIAEGDSIDLFGV